MNLLEKKEIEGGGGVELSDQGNVLHKERRGLELKDEGAQRNKERGVSRVGQRRHTKRHREKVGVWS
jgi:hypothetical protein